MKRLQDQSSAITDRVSNKGDKHHNFDTIVMSTST